MSAAIAILIFEQSYGAGKDSERCSSPDAYLAAVCAYLYRRIERQNDLMKAHKFAFNYRFRKMNELAKNGNLNNFRVDPHNDIEELKWMLEVAPREGRFPTYTRKQFLDLLRDEYPKLINDDSIYQELLLYKNR